MQFIKKQIPTSDNIYDKYYSDTLSKKDLSVEQKTNFINIISNIDNDIIFKNIYLLIKTFQLKQDETNVDNIPYKIIHDNDKLEIQIKNLPIQLRHLLFKYLTDIV